MKSLTFAMLLGLALNAQGRDSEDILVDGEREDNAIRLEEPVTGGTQCGSSRSLKLKLEDGVLKVKFDEFAVQSRGSRLERETCLFSAAMEWPQGYRVVLKDLSLRGSADVHSGRAVARAELFTTGGVGQALEITATGEGKFARVQRGVVSQSGCSGSGLLRLNSSLRLTGSGSLKVNRLKAELSLEACE